MLLERLRQHRSSLPDGRGNERRRRPSTIAEQAMMRGASQNRPVLASVKQGTFSRTTDCVTLPLNMLPANQQQLLNDMESLGAEHMPYIPPKGQPLNGSGGGGNDNLITSSIDEGVEVDISEKDSDAGSRASSVCSNTSQQASIISHSTSFADSSSALTRSSVFGDLSQRSNTNTSNQSLSTGIGSPFASFDSNIEADLMSSQSSCTTPPSLPSCSYSHQKNGCNQHSAITATMTPPVASKFPHNRESCMDKASEDRSDTSSPTSFREGRRASDGLMSQGIFPFRQRLKESMKTRGVAELRKEMECLANQFKQTVTEQELIHLQQQHHAYHAYHEKNTQPRQWSLEERLPIERPVLTTKRRSLPCPIPGVMDLGPHKMAMGLKRHIHTDAKLTAKPPVAGGTEVVGGGQSGSGYPGQGKPLQQQLLHHRLQQKRQEFQKQSQLPHWQPPQPPHQQAQPQLFQQFQQMQIDGAQSAAQHDLPPVQTLDQASVPGEAAMTDSLVAAETVGLGLDTCDLSLDLGVAAGTGVVIPPDGGNPTCMLLPNDCITSVLPGRSEALVLSPGTVLPVAGSIPLALSQQYTLSQRRHMVRQSSYKLAQQQPVLPLAEKDRLLWMHSCENPPLSPMFEESNEHDETEEVTNSSSQEKAENTGGAGGDHSMELS